ncbi:hypothetical protein T492DRAFT_845795 [Pavlovales sp. CCMP2436]|nr:hypothetical protein T492DRAFT_845795 [Pavlovales sp. CCMP2436]
MWAECAGFLGQSRARRVATYSDGTTITGTRLRDSGKAAVYLLAASDTDDAGGHYGIEGRLQRRLSAANGNKWGVQTGGALLMRSASHRHGTLRPGKLKVAALLVLKGGLGSCSTRGGDVSRQWGWGADAIEGSTLPRLELPEVSPKRAYDDKGGASLSLGHGSAGLGSGRAPDLSSALGFF